MKKILGIVIILLALSTPVDAHFIWGDADVERDVIAGGNVYGENLFPDNWDNAYGWGDHSLVGYLTSYNETDPVFTDHDAFAVSSLLIGQWNNAYGWGNHASAGYLTSYDETDPVFLAHDAFDITSADITLLGNTSGENSGDQDLSGKEDVGVASGLISIHTTTHPIPTTRDARNEIAKGEDDNFVTDADITLLGNTSGTNTNDVTITDTDEIDLTITLQDIKADIKSDSIDETKLDTSTNISLNLADTSVQPNDPLTTLDTTVTGSQLNQMYTDTHIPATGSDTSKIDISVTGQEVGATITANSIDTGDLTSAIGTSLGKADSATQPTDLLDYFLEDGQSDNIVNGTFDLTTTGKLGATVLENTAGDLKLQPDGQGEISLFEDRDWNGVADYTSFNMHRKDSSAIGNSRFRMRIDPWGQGYFSFTGSHFLFSGGGDLRYTATKDLDLRQTDPTYAINFGSRWDEDENQKVKYYGGDGSVVKYVQFQLGSDMYFKTTPKDATVLGWNIWMDVAVDGDITADNLGTASAEDVGYFEPAKGTDDNFVTDYQLSILSTLVSHTWVNS